MRDITSKQISLRKAIAIGFVACEEQTYNLIIENRLPKGNLFDIARAAGYLGAKQTQHLIPHCHPVSIDGLEIRFETLNNHSTHDYLGKIEKFGVLIIVEAQSIGRTGIEIEALTAVSICGLTIYDLLKPLNDSSLEISSIRLIEKKGGKSDRSKFFIEPQKAAILVCSDTTFEGKSEDKSGLLIKELLEKYNTTILEYNIVSDEPTGIKEQLLSMVSKDIPFIFTSGGTGLGPRDNTIEVVKSIVEKEAIGIAEAMRAHGQMRTPLAMFSRSFAGTLNKTTIICLPGSTKGVKESLEAILPAIFHANNMLNGERH